MLTNEQEIWDRLRNEGWTKEQVAGIVGNLIQESNLKTDDTPGGLGIAQWIGARRQNLINLGRYEELGTQLNYLIYELRRREVVAGNALLAAKTVEEATIAFQDKYERCGTCRTDNRIKYAQEVYNRH
jgi:hypothetical protein